MARQGTWSIAIALVLASGTATAPAQEVVLNQLYGSGVHAYFAGNYNQALQDLAMAIDDGSKDPRAFYFRGLAELRLGMPEVANEDFARGAELEAKAVDRFYPVSRSLERVQGHDRLALEKHRALARVAVYRAQQAKDKERYEQFQRAEQEVLREPRRATPLPKDANDQPATPAKQPAATKAVEGDPFADEVDAKPADEKDAKPAAEEADPFSDAPANDEAAIEHDASSDDKDDPLGTDAGKADAKELDQAKEDEDKAEADDEDPLGAGDDTADKEDAKTKDADAEDPFTDDTEPVEGGDDVNTDDKKPADNDKSADKEEDPFN